MIPLPTMDYDTPLQERIDSRDWYCNNHGEIDRKHLGISAGGELYCKVCSAANIGQPNDPLDTSVISKEHRDYANNSNAVSIISITHAVPWGRQTAIQQTNALYHEGETNVVLSLIPEDPKVVV